MLEEQKRIKITIQRTTDEQKTEKKATHTHRLEGWRREEKEERKSEEKKKRNG